MGARLRAGVIGAGVFGGYHAQKWAAMAGASLSAVFDTHPERAAALAERAGGRAFDDMKAFLEAVDVVSVATPASHHGPRALQVLRAGKAVYIEKPLAVTLAEADAIVGEAARRGLIVACGFLERVAFAAIGLLDFPEAPRALAATRLGTPSPRNQDVSVVLDLMIHDLDLILAIAPGAPLTVEAEGAPGPSGHWDEMSAEITFDSGFVARLRASRVAPAAERSMVVAYPSGEARIDFLRGEVKADTREPLNTGFADSPAVKDRLHASLAAFAAAVRGVGAPLADAAAGARALDLALAVEHAAGG